MSLVATVRTLGKKLDNYITDATDNAAGNEKFDSTTEQTYTVPTGKRWLFMYGYLKLDVNATFTAYLFNVDDELVAVLASAAAGTGRKTYPGTLSGSINGSLGYPYPMDEGDYIKLTAGAAQGAGAAASCAVLEVDV